MNGEIVIKLNCFKVFELLIHPSPLSNLVSLEYFQQLVSEHCGSQDKSLKTLAKIKDNEDIQT
jgi:hypothetical protein